MNIKLIILLEDALEYIKDNADCVSMTCDCEGNDISKDLVRRIVDALNTLKGV